MTADRWRKPPEKKASADCWMGTSTPPGLSEDIPEATWVGELSTHRWQGGGGGGRGARISSACQWDTALLMGPEPKCVDLPQAHTHTHPHPLAHAVPCQSIV